MLDENLVIGQCLGKFFCLASLAKDQCGHTVGTFGLTPRNFSAIHLKGWQIGLGILARNEAKRFACRTDTVARRKFRIFGKKSKELLDFGSVSQGRLRCVKKVNRNQIGMGRFSNRDEPMNIMPSRDSAAVATMSGAIDNTRTRHFATHSLSRVIYNAPKPSDFITKAA